MNLRAGAALHQVRRLSGEKVLDATQVSYLSEECILVDGRDRQMGSATKRDAHTWTNVEKGGCLHRAFSVFIFNSEKQMLMQRRSAAKITFPGMWTNSCCSHPLDRESERDGAAGIVTAAKRKLCHEEEDDAIELGFTGAELEWTAVVPVARILYKAQCPPPDDAWGEHELDHVLFLTNYDVPPKPNPNEVSEVVYVGRSELGRLLGDSGKALTPWFRLIAERFLPRWWDNLHNLPSVQDYDHIHRFA